MSSSRGGGGNGHGRGYQSGRRDPEDVKRRSGRGSPPDSGNHRERGEPPKRPRTESSGLEQVDRERPSGSSCAPRGSGGSRGRGDGRRGARRGDFVDRRQRDLERLDSIRTDPRSIEQVKKGTLGTSIKLRANYFPVQASQAWSLQNYRVDFEPEQELTHNKKSLVRAQANVLPAYIFDGSTLYTATPLGPELLELYTDVGKNGVKDQVKILLKLTGTVEKGDPQYLQVYNIIVRQCFQLLDFDELGRHFYDRLATIHIGTYNIELWPGYITSMRNHENNILLCVEVTNKILRLDTALQIIRGSKSNADAERTLVGSIVMTQYNRKTYRIDSIDWANGPSFEFEQKQQMVSLASYYHTRYNLKVRDYKQPLLVSLPRARDHHRGDQGPILLLPEFCTVTGIPEEFRGDQGMKRAMQVYTQQPPDRRVTNVCNFMKRLQDKEPITQLLDKWGLGFSGNPNNEFGMVKLTGRVQNPEKLQMRNKFNKEPKDILANEKADWTHHLRDSHMWQSFKLEKWVIIVTKREASGIDNLVRVMDTVGSSLGFSVRQPIEVLNPSSPSAKDFNDKVTQAVRSHQPQMIFCVLPGGNPNNRETMELYGAIKKRCCIDFGTPSQCFMSKHLEQNKSRNLMSVTTKVVIQMNAKLGGVPWVAINPFKSKHTMIVGFDVHHSGKQGNSKGPSVGAMVSTTDRELSKYFSCISFHEGREALSKELCSSFTQCLISYARKNDKNLPERIFMYRDGAGEGQLAYIKNTELAQIQEILVDVYQKSNQPKPLLTFIVVTKKGNTRFFRNSVPGKYENPPPGTVVDDVVTLPERYDFFLISQDARQGTVSPTTYNVIEDSNRLLPERLQVFTYKLCHLYYNWSGTVAVPAVCQYAHKLSYLTGLALGNSATIHENLSDKLFFL